MLPSYKPLQERDGSKNTHQLVGGMSFDWRLERRERDGKQRNGREWESKTSMRGNWITAPEIDEIPDNERCPIAAWGKLLFIAWQSGTEQEACIL